MSDHGESDNDEVAPVTLTKYEIGVETEVPQTGGQLFKTVHVEGQGGSPPSGAKVTVHYVGTLASDGSVFDSSRERGQPFDFTIGQKQVIQGWDKGVATMKIGEKSTLKCLPEYAYGAKGSPPKIPPNATLNFEVELLDWTKDEDVSEEHNKTIMKRIVQEGSDYTKPTYESEVVVSVDIVVGGKSTFHNDNWTFTIGDVDLPIGLERVITSMKKGEVCVATVSGSIVKQDGADGILRGKDVQYKVTLISFTTVKTWDAKGNDKVTEALKRKDQGNAYFSGGALDKALQKYSRGLEFVEHSYDLEGDAVNEAKKAKVILYTNAAQALIGLKRYKEAVEKCNKALEADAVNVKALFRRGRAQALADEWEDAKQDFRKVLEIDSANADARRELSAVQAKEREYEQKLKSKYQKLFQ